MPYDMTNKLAGDEISSTYEGRHIEMTETLLTHPLHGDNLVDKGDPVLVGKQVGVAFRSAALNSDLIAIDTEGIWALLVEAVDQNGNSAVARGDRIYINKTNAELNKINTPATHMPFGIALSTLVGGGEDIVAVKVHQDPETMGEIACLTSEELDHAAFTGAGAVGTIDITSGQLPARALVLGTSVNVTEAFTGDTTGIIQVGVAGDLDRFSSVTDQSVYAITRVAMGIPTDGQDGFAAAQTVRVTITGSAAWASVTAGKCFVTIYYIPLA